MGQVRRWWQGARRGGDRAGRQGERLAAGHLRRRGYRIIARNVTSRLGEIDLVARAPDGRTLVLVEVKTSERRHEQLRPEIRVTLAKQRRLVALAADFARRRGYTDCPLRFDVVAVVLGGSENHREVRHHLGAFASHV